MQLSFPLDICIAVLDIYKRTKTVKTARTLVYFPQQMENSFKDC